MPKIVGYYSHPSSSMGQLPDILGVNQIARQAAESALPVIEEKLNEKLLYAGIAAGIMYVGLVGLIWVRTAK